MIELSRTSADLALAAPPEGAGVVAAGVVQLSAALVESLARSALPTWPEARGAAVQAATLRARADESARANARTYGAAREALAMPGAPGASRHDATLRARLFAAADTLLAIVEVATDCALLAAEVSGRCPPGLRSDAAGAADLASAAARAVTALVEINLALLPGDERRVRARELVKTAEAARADAFTALES